jgi:lipid-A-disaccharide synthase
MPGSRRGEVSSLLPAMLDAVESLQRERPVEPFVIQAPTIHREELLAQMGGRDVRIVSHDGGAALESAHVALSSSGTATLEAAVLGTPVVVMYRLSRLTYILAKRLVALPHFGLINIVAGEAVVPELIQDDVNGERIAAEVRSLLEWYDTVLAGLDRVRARLGGEGASRRAAEEIHRMLASA